MIGEFGPATPKELSAITAVQPNTISTAIAKIEKRGHITRRPNESDGRSVLVELSPEGRIFTDKAMALNVSLLERLSSIVDLAKAQNAIVDLDDAARVLANMPSRPGRE